MSIQYGSDERIVMTLDAGGTNFVFSAIRGNKEMIEPFSLPSYADDLEKCLDTIKEGFTRVKDMIPGDPAAISFAFPGPADYPAGIIGDLPNLKAFRGGVALGPMLEESFNIPVYINNDGDLFTYGEAIAGFLPYLNGLLEEFGSPKRFRNLFGITLGTGFGGGIVYNGQLYIGDNSVAAEIWCTRNKLIPSSFAEEGASIRAVQRVYRETSGNRDDRVPSPKDIFEIATGDQQGDREAARTAFQRLGETIGDALANAISLLDAPVVIGGGLAGAASLFFPAIVSEMNGHLEGIDGTRIPRLVMKAYNLEDERELETFVRGEKKEIKIPGSRNTIVYDPLMRTGIGISRLGTSRAVGIGAYAFALSSLDRKGSGN